MDSLDRTNASLQALPDNAGADFPERFLTPNAVGCG